MAVDRAKPAQGGGMPVNHGNDTGVLRDRHQKALDVTRASLFDLCEELSAA